MRSKASRPLLTCLALLALGWAQVFGMMRGYVCDCAGAPEISAFDHCHGEHGVACRHDAVPSHHDEGAPPHRHDGPSDCSQDHVPLKETVQSKQISIEASLVPLPIMAVVSILEPLTMLQASIDPVHRSFTAADDGSVLRRWPSVITRTIALRV